MSLIDELIRKRIADDPIEARQIIKSYGLSLSESPKIRTKIRRSKRKVKLCK